MKSSRRIHRALLQNVDRVAAAASGIRAGREPREAAASSRRVPAALLSSPRPPWPDRGAEFTSTARGRGRATRLRHSAAREIRTWRDPMICARETTVAGEYRVDVE